MPLRQEDEANLASLANVRQRVFECTPGGGLAGTIAIETEANGVGQTE